MSVGQRRAHITLVQGISTDGRMTGANFNLVTVKVKLNENDPEPEQHLEEVGGIR